MVSGSDYLRRCTISTLGQIKSLALHRWEQFSSLTKVISALTAVIGFATAVVTAYTGVSGYFGHQAEVGKAIAVADRQLSTGDYAQAWKSNGSALQIAPGNEPAKRQQLTIALRWVEHVTLNSKVGPQSFGDVVEPLERVVIQNETGAQGTALADLEAHVAWSHFLRSRDGVSGLDIAGQLDAALQADPQNMYAHLYRGFWILWQGKPLASARPDLDAALTSTVDPAYSDRIVMVALFNEHADEIRAGAIDYTNRIRKSGRDLPESPTRGDVLAIYEDGLTDPDFLARLSQVISFDDHLATLDWTQSGYITEERRQNVDALKGYYLERQGKTADALEAYRSVVARAPSYGTDAGDFSKARIRGLTATKPKK
ncbi:MAG TPA: hypothetical protein VGV37_24670 [Aliidongia sp.]|uniref:hypothetical protein n=1 Tax=Aliidongia sp. TaxID=1914230 RepID=UPI002DDCF000|nr:hypothetical protein [Aliidongia sp.]HEV2677748.1 hypothetical protein [Aliidongia sp.]